MMPAAVDLGREDVAVPGAGEDREWLVTNGRGGYASGTLSGVRTRRYHGLLVAATRPPVGRVLLLARLEEWVAIDGRDVPLFTNRWADGTVDPSGHRHLEGFRLEGTTPVWTYVFGEARIEKRVFMARGADATCVRYELVRGGSPVRIRISALVAERDHHALSVAGDREFRVTSISAGLRVQGGSDTPPLHLFCPGARIEPAHVWHLGYDLAEERNRGLGEHEDLLLAGVFTTELQPGRPVTLMASTDSSLPNPDRLLDEVRSHESGLWERYAACHPGPAARAPAWIRQLVLAADQFVVDRPFAGGAVGKTIIAGYPWFGDWGRDTMIALPGLTLTTGRPEAAREILGTFARYVDRGMLPNYFPSEGEAPEYNTVDATLWYFEAIRQYVEATGDLDLARDLFPVLEDILDWHERGTRYGIGMDPADGLLRAGEPGVQLTWMDARVDGREITPRTGKPVEVNALWFGAHRTMAGLARRLERDSSRFERRAERIRAGLERFWNPAGGCYDVLDGPQGADPSVRPNQIFLAGLSPDTADPARRRTLIDLCARELLTSFGLRSLAPSHPDYAGRYQGGPRERDGVYHQGTVWGWLLGPFALAHYRTYGDRETALSFLEPMRHHLTGASVGTASEIFDGDPPHASRGAVAQAWTVAEVLRAWTLLQEADSHRPPVAQVERPRRAKRKPARRDLSLKPASTR